MRLNTTKGPSARPSRTGSLKPGTGCGAWPRMSPKMMPRAKLKQPVSVHTVTELLKNLRTHSLEHPKLHAVGIELRLHLVFALLDLLRWIRAKPNIFIIAP